MHGSEYGGWGRSPAVLAPTAAKHAAAINPSLIGFTGLSAGTIKIVPNSRCIAASGPRLHYPDIYITQFDSQTISESEITTQGPGNTIWEFALDTVS